MAEIVNVYREAVPALRFIRKKYVDFDRLNGNFGAKWGEWFKTAGLARWKSNLTGKWRNSAKTAAPTSD